MPENETPETPGAATPEPAEAPTTPAAQEDKPLGPNGEKALASEREARRALERRLAEFEAADKARREAEMTEVQKAEAAREESAKEAEALRIELAINKAAVAHGLTPEDAEALQGVPLDRIEALAARLAAAKPATPGAAPAAKQGIGAPTTVGGQLTEADMRSMTPEQINEARRAGRFNDLLGIKP